ncbi:tail protein [Roseobacter phage RDJL Phi 1]|uniref:Gene transfer agent n=1 Tax=Roseobacter phage RDJL Phi 1 TaxID=562742 RepID=F4YXU5_9CAUD|nr:tail protein [Roseobacter phage RDJL Phi 1]ADK73485.1 gene transfer agent [Roseobacter phage RDJL Phi 1]
MATLVLGALVSSAGLTGFTAFAASLAANAIGGLIDNALFGPPDIQQDGPRLNEIQLSTSSEGSPIRRIWGRTRLGGNVIWAANFKETKTTETQGGGKGGGGPSVTTTTYTYSLSFAVAFCEGNARTTLGRVWADGKLLDTESLDVTFYPGSATQSKDPTIEGVEGTNNTPAFRNVAYMVFKDMPLAEVGNRIPSITAEILKPLDNPDPDSVEELIEGINLIPSTGEAAYATTPTVRDDGFGNAVPENVNLSRSQSNLANSMDNLTKQLPNNGKVNLVTGWFGTDLRASHCEFKPKVELKTGRQLLPNSWLVNGLVRSSPQVEAVSIDGDGNPAFGGTPADFSIVEAIQRMANEDGLDVNFYPFILMDIEAGNTLPDTETGAAGQPVYPWRGRITTSLPSVDKTATAQTEVDSLFGSVTASDFSISGTTVNYTGSSTDFGYRRMVLHYAHLCAAAANSLDTPSKFNTFFIGTELRGITRIRSTAASTATGSTIYPGVNALVQLMEDVRAIFDAQGLTGVKLSYAADWSEYHSHRPSDGSNDVYFNMDAIWGHADCDFVAIDNYMPLSDWRDGTAHEDYGTGDVTAYATTGTFGSASFPQSTSIYDKDYLKGQVEGGEGYDYFYASDADRESQTRTKIEDTAHSEHWVFRQKDIRNWWNQSHRSRPGGTRDASVVALNDGASGSVDTWTVNSKKVIFSELGAPAVDKATNQPNVFFDPKSSESFLPYHSSGNRDDFIQRLYYEAMIAYWRDNSPTSPITMIDPSDMYAWTWDARPYPAFPYRSDIWSDGPNYRLGHWLNGRVGVLTLGQLVREICKIGGLAESDIDITGLVNSAAIVRGYVIDTQASPREMLAPLSNAFLFDGFETGGKIKFQLRSNTLFTTVTEDELVVSGEDVGGFQLTRTQETELPSGSTVSFIDEAKEYQVGSVGGVRLVGSSRNVINQRFPIVLTEEYARSLSEVLIQQAWSARERGELKLPPSYLALDPSDGISMASGGRTIKHIIGRIERGTDLSMSTASHDVSVFETLTFSTTGNFTGDIPVFGRSILYILEMPLVNGEEPQPWSPRLATYQSPFPASVDFYRKEGGSLTLNKQLTLEGVLGETTATLASADPWRFDGSGTLSVMLYNPSATLLSATKTEVLNGANAVAVETSSGFWEVIQFTTATLTGSSSPEGLPLYDLTGLLRGQLGTEAIMDSTLASGAKFILLEQPAINYIDLPQGQKTFDVDYRYGPAGVDTGSAIFQDVSHTGKATGLLPYAPHALRKEPTAGSTEVTFTWVRRTRFSGDDFEEESTPLNEENERYDLEIYDPSGPTLLRTVSDLTVPSYTYTTAEQTSDGGALDSYTIRVWQKSTSIGRGRQAEATL